MQIELMSFSTAGEWQNFFRNKTQGGRWRKVVFWSISQTSSNVNGKWE